jgi:nucleotide-binding universal stress UspA family protein
MYDTILAAIDSSDESRAALEHAVDLGEAVDASIHVVTVLEVRKNPMRFGVGEVDALDEAATELVEELLAVHDHREVEVNGEVLRGKPATTLLEYADEIDAGVIIAGQKGAGGITGTLVGSTTDRLVRLADRPLTIVPVTDE